MTSELQKIYYTYKNNQKFSMDSMSQLSRDTNNNVNLVSDSTQAFDFDGVTKQLNKSKPSRPTSVDALYINNKISFIEFKRGYKPSGYYNDKYMENIIKSAKDSLNTHKDYLSKFPDITYSNSYNTLVAVINSGKDGRPSTAFGEALANRASIESSLMSKLKSDLMKSFSGGIYYSFIYVWNDINFSDGLKAYL